MFWLVWAIPLIVIIFLWSLNEFMRGKLTQIISIILAFLIFGLIAFAFLASGWAFGLGALIGSLILGAIFHFPAAVIAKQFVP